MIFIKATNKIYLFSSVNAVALPFPFCFYSNIIAEHVKRHETIHSRQFMEVAFLSLIVLNVLISFEVLNSYYWFFASYPVYYIVYLAEMLVRRFMYDSWDLAYRNISFEREAYKNQNNTTYLSNRLPFSFLIYLSNKEKE